MERSYVKKIILTLLLTLSLVGVAEGLTSQEAQDIVHLVTGDYVVVHVDTSEDFPNGVFSTWPMPIIVLWQPTWFPDNLAMVILLHEAAHYLQVRDGLWEMDQKDFEWAADVMGMNLGCELGLVTWQDYHDLWMTMIARYGDQCSISHGCWLDRMVHGLAYATQCHPAIPKVEIQAP
jgi:hypothetical protein